MFPPHVIVFLRKQALIHLLESRLLAIIWIIHIYIKIIFIFLFREIDDEVDGLPLLVQEPAHPLLHH